MADAKVQFTAAQIEIAKKVNKAVVGFGTNDTLLIETLASSKAQDLAMANVYYLQQYGESMIQAIKGDTILHYSKTAVALCHTNADYDAMLVHDAIAGLGTDEDLLIETTCTRNGYETKAMEASYQRMYGKNMIQEVKEDVSGDFRKFLALLLSAPRTVMPPAAQMDKDVETLYQAGEGHWGTNEEAFIKIFASNPKQYVEQVAIKYSVKHNKVLENVLKSEFSGVLKKALIVIATPTDQYLADKLYNAMKGAGTKDSHLIRIIVSQRERHLKNVCIAFMQKYKKTLREVVETETIAHYRTLLCSIIAVAQKS